MRGFDELPRNDTKYSELPSTRAAGPFATKTAGCGVYYDVSYQQRHRRRHSKLQRRSLWVLTFIRGQLCNFRRLFSKKKKKSVITNNNSKYKK